MKKYLALFIFLALALSACQKFEITAPDNQIYYPAQPGQQSNYVWNGCNPQPEEFLGKTPVSGYSNVFDYSFRIHLSGSQINPISNQFSIPHVGPGGILIYYNVANDATYTITQISGGWVYYTIRSESGHTLKYNIAVWDSSQGKWIWFLRYGLPYDDGVNNMIIFYTN